jgi:plasmid maintenance system antidote protein VapI
MDRKNDLLEECLVAKKFMDSRLSFEKRTPFRQSFENISDNLYEECDNIDLESDYKEFNPNLAFVAMSCMNSIFKLGRGDTIRDCLHMYDFSNHTYDLNVNDVMNNRGSVRYQGKDGIKKLEVIEKEVIETIDGKEKKTTKTEVISQISKCYKTTMENLCNFQDDNDEYKEETDANKLLSTTTSIMPLVLYNSRKKFRHIGRMVKKGEIGPREIGVLNSPMRISSYFVESLARHQRAVEHKLNEFTNMIEEKSKDEKLNKTFEETIREERYYFDNADCSKWGPSQLSYVLYLVLGCRIKDKHIRNLLKFQLQMFSNKIIKFPIKAGLRKVDNPDVKSMIDKVCYQMSNLPENIGNSDIGYFNCPEGIIQGILGNTTSLLAADNLRMIESVLMTQQTLGREPMFKKITSFIPVTTFADV